MTSAQLLQKVRTRPRSAASYGLALLKGYFYKGYLRLRGRRFSAGRRFRVYGRLIIKGPGRVVFGDDVMIGGVTTPFTHSPEATITVGDHTVLSGTRFGAAVGVTIGRDCIVADCRIFDTDFHSIAVNRHDDDAPVHTAPVVVGNNVWLAAQTALMPGTTIRDNSVVGFGAVCSGAFPADVLIVGNPARLAGKVPGAEGRDAAGTQPSPQVHAARAMEPAGPPVASG